MMTMMLDVDCLLFFDDDEDAVNADADADVDADAADDCDT